MKLACDLIKPWLVPFSEGTLRVHRPSLHAAVRRHLSGCASCRQDEVLLHKTAMALRRHSQKSSFWKWHRDRAELSREIPLSSRVLRAVQAERLNLASRASRSARRAYPLLAYATSVALLCIFFAFLTQPSFARPWLERYFLSRPHVAHSIKHGPVTPPYPMHDPFAVPAPNFVGGAPFEPRTANLNPFAHGGARSSSAKMRTASLAPTYGSGTGVNPIFSTSASPAAQGDIQAREAMTAAERAEEARFAGNKATNLAPKNPVSAGFAMAPTANSAAATSAAPITVGRSVATSSSSENSVAAGSALPAPAQSKPGTNPTGTAQVKTLPPIPDATPPSAGAIPTADSPATASH